jgi:hypothetical protein
MRTQRHPLPRLLAILVLTACAAQSTRPSTIAQPEIHLKMPASIFFGSSSTAPASIEVEIKNTADVPIRLRDIELSSPGMTEYTIRPVRRTFNEVIEPGQTRTFPLFATAVSNIGATTPTEPLSLRAFLSFEANGAKFREVASQM